MTSVTISFAWSVNRLVIVENVRDPFVMSANQQGIVTNVAVRFAESAGVLNTLRSTVDPFVKRVAQKDAKSKADFRVVCVYVCACVAQCSVTCECCRMHRRSSNRTSLFFF